MLTGTGFWQEIRPEDGSTKIMGMGKTGKQENTDGVLFSVSDLKSTECLTSLKGLRHIIAALTGKV